MSETLPRSDVGHNVVRTHDEQQASCWRSRLIGPKANESDNAGSRELRRILPDEFFAVRRRRF